MKQRTIARMMLLLVGCAGWASCQKVINVNLQSAPSKYVIEGNVTDQPGPYTVTITRSVSFTQDNVYPTVSGALVVITDETGGVADTLKEASPGNYTTSRLAGIPGHQYTLYANINNSVFQATGKMPGSIVMDSLYIQPSPFGGNLQVVPVYTDPVAKGNYYHFVEVKNDTLMSAVYIRNDQLVNGQRISQPLGGENGSKIDHGDFLIVYLECIDSAVYQYFYGLQQSENQNSASPANPISNISGGCLGYFSVHTSFPRTLVVP